MFPVCCATHIQLSTTPTFAHYQKSSLVRAFFVWYNSTAVYVNAFISLFPSMPYIIFLSQLLLAIILGAMIGWQRQHIGKAAGIRTYALVSLGSTLFTLLSLYGFTSDPGRVAGQILTGIGFIGAGTIIHKGGGVEGLTTAAGLWAMAAIGMAIGIGWYWQAAVATGIILLLLLIDDKK